MQFRQSGAFTTDYVTAVETYFDELRQASGMEDYGMEFTLDSGHIAIITPDTEERELQRLTHSWPEYSALIPSAPSNIWKIVILEDNDFIMTYFCEEGLHPSVDQLALAHLEPDL